MNVLLVSQCSGRAIPETRRILDQFAERRGTATWQTTITQAGLITLRKLLKASARRNTSVACHWIRGRDRSELIWVVGNASRFNAEGAVPTNTTSHNVLRANDENQWQHGELIRLAAGIAGLFHDFGKANQLFQRKLRSNKSSAEPCRHEWVSLRLFQAIIADCESDHDWLQRLTQMDENSANHWQRSIAGIQDGVDEAAAGNNPLNGMPPFAKLVGWLVVSHHKLPANDELTGKRLKRELLPQISRDWNSAFEPEDPQDWQRNWNFEHRIPTVSRSWRQKTSELAKRALAHSELGLAAPEKNLFVSHIARLCLMWGDHYYSSQDSKASRGDANFPLHANTYYDKGSPRHGELKQRLDEHLIGVAYYSARLQYLLPTLNQNLPRIARHSAFKRRSANERFRWQDKAYELARSIQAGTEQQGFFGINMASTGCGKTLANARIMYALANPQRGARFSVALGLRTLTLQTGDAFRERLGLSSDDLAVMVGGVAVRTLHEMNKKEAAEQSKEQRSAAFGSGSESADPLLDNNSYVHYEGSIADGHFGSWLEADPRTQKLISAPILVSTIDHLIPATEGVRGGRQIAPMLRLLTSDLVLDEPDDFGLEDLPALTRLVHWAGLLGSRVLLSSATLPPALVEGLFNAYSEGRRSFQQSCGRPGLPVNIHCGWFDEFGKCQHLQTGEPSLFAEAHGDFVAKRVQSLSARQQPKVVAAIAELPIDPTDELAKQRQQFADNVRKLALRLHKKNHQKIPTTNKRISLGLLRMANIDPLCDVTRELFALGGNANTRLHLCCYHSQHPLLIRTRIEATLDACLQRGDKEALFQNPEIAAAITAEPNLDHIFLVAASPVAEVGRDHSYDWAIVEPSSMRSIIQLAGRVRRHWPERWEQQNIALLNSNLKHFRNQGQKPAFNRPGFESDAMLLSSHQLTELLLPEQFQPLNATSRITERKNAEPRDNLVDLEHDRLRSQTHGTGQSRAIPNPLWWQTGASLTSWFQQRTRFRSGQKMGDYALVPNELGRGLDLLLQGEQRGQWQDWSHYLNADAALGTAAHAWAVADYEETLEAMAEKMQMETEECAKRFGMLSLNMPENQQNGWLYHPLLGFRRNP